MIEIKKTARQLETRRCPVCRLSVAGDEVALAAHVAHEHAKPQNRMGEIIWINPPHEAVFMGKLYKRMTQ